MDTTTDVSHSTGSGTTSQKAMLALAFQTGAHWHMLVPRLVAGGLLTMIGISHVTGASPILPILRGTPIPAPELMAVVAPLMQVAAGVLLLLGILTRLGGLLAIGTMIGAVISHVTFEAYQAGEGFEAFAWPDEPPIVMAIVVLILAAYAVLRGGGRLSIDRAITRASA